MLISIHDVPRDERHLLFCSRLNHSRPPHRHRRRRHSVSTGADVTAPGTLIVLPMAGSNGQRGAA